MKRILSWFVCLALLAGMLPHMTLVAKASVYSGTCSSSVFWEVDTGTGVLTIGGSGKIPDNSQPWGQHNKYIKSVEIEEGITEIGEYVFSNMGFESIMLPQGLTKIGDRAFQYATGMKTIYIPLSCTSMGFCAFNYCWSLTDVYYEGDSDQFNAIGKAYAGLGGFDDLFDATKHYNYEYPTEADKVHIPENWRRVDGFNFYMSYPSNYLTVGDRVNLHVGYYIDDVIDAECEGYLYTVSNSDCIQVVNKGWSDNYGQMLEIKALKEGSAVITVNHPKNGAVSTLEVFVLPAESGWTFTNVPKMEIEEGRTTNFYNYSGMVVDEFTYTPHYDASGIVDYYVVTMNVFNSVNLYGAVTSYDAKGFLHEYRVVDKMSEYDVNFVSSLKSLYHNANDIYCLVRNDHFYSGKSITKETPVRIQVPVGGHLLISNNIGVSTVANIANFCGLVVDLAFLIKKVEGTEIPEESWFYVKQSVIDATMTELIVQGVEDRINKALVSAVGETCSAGTMSADTIIEAIATINDKIIQFVSVDLVAAIEKKIASVEGTAVVGESVLKKVLPTGWLINIMYTFSRALDFSAFLHRYCISAGRPDGIFIYAPVDPGAYISNGVMIETDTVDSNVIVHAYQVVDEGFANISADTFPCETTYYGDQFQTYSITMYKNGKESQPDTPVAVKIPVPNGFNRDAIKVYRNNEDGTLTNMHATVIDGYAVFETEHFSYYSVVDESEPVTKEELKFSKILLSLTHNLEASYKVKKALLDELNCSNPYAVFTINGAKTVVKDYTVEDEYYVFTFKDIAPNKMNDTIYASLYAAGDEVQYTSIPHEYSIARYCYSMLKRTTDSKLQALLVDLLNYGAASQKYTNYRTDALVNADLTDEQKQWGTLQTPDMESIQNGTYEVVEDPDVVCKSASLVLYDSVAVRLKFTADSIDGLSLRVRTDYGEWSIGANQFEEHDGAYYVIVDKLNAGQMRDALYLTFYMGNTVVSNTLRYSIESYAFKKQNTIEGHLGELVVAMMKYGDSAYVYAGYDENATVVASGDCGAEGDNVTWNLYSDGRLVISGAGAMMDYSYNTAAPWQSYCSSIKRVIMSAGITRVGDYAFENCNDITKLSLPAGLTNVGAYAFYGCTSLTNIELPESVFSIEEGAFASCTGLTEMVIPESVVDIERFVFSSCGNLKRITVNSNNAYYCSDTQGVLYNRELSKIVAVPCALINVEIPTGVTIVAEGAFYGAENLTSITIPDGVTSIEAYAFRGCGNLMDITIPKSVTNIGNFAFFDCSKLKNVFVPDGVTSIGNAVFWECSSLTSIEIPESVTSIGYSSFRNCTGLESITFKGSAPTFISNSFYGVTATVFYPADDTTWTSDVMQDYGGTITWILYSDGGIIDYGACGASGDNLLWTLYVDGRLVISGEGAMADYAVPVDSPWIGNTQIKSITIDEGVTHLGNCSFFNCNEATRVSLPDSLISIGDRVFTRCISLDSVMLPNSLTSVGYAAFYGCSSLTSITIPDSMTTIGAAGFSGCENLVSIVVSTNNENYCTDPQGILYNKDKTTIISVPGSLSSVEIPQSVTSIVDGAFGYCKNLERLTLPDSITSIGVAAFSGCSKLMSITLPDSITSIGEETFFDCTNLTSVTIPDGVTSIGSYAFYGCTSLTSITFEGNAPTIGTNVFYKVTATAGYPAENTTWTSEVMQNYGGTITWVPYTSTDVETA